MFLLSFIPDAWLQMAVIAIMVVGAGLYFLSFFTKLILVLMPYKEPLRILGTVLMIAGVYFYGSYDTEIHWREQVRQAEEKVKQAERESQQANEDLAKERKRKNQVIVQTQVQIEERIKEVEKVIDAKCTLTPESIKILNDAARNPLVSK